MKIQKQFAPIIITVETETDLRFLEEALHSVIQLETRGWHGMGNSSIGASPIGRWCEETLRKLK
jgi:hypothetical protein